MNSLFLLSDYFLSNKYLFSFIFFSLFFIINSAKIIYWFVIILIKQSKKDIVLQKLDILIRFKIFM